MPLRTCVSFSFAIARHLHFLDLGHRAAGFLDGRAL